MVDVISFTFIKAFLFKIMKYVQGAQRDENLW
jgi:hypothetical protein